MPEEESNRNDALEELKALVSEREATDSYWQSLLPTLRAQASASSAVLTELVQHQQATRGPRRAVDAILAAPDEPWADQLIRELTAAVPNLRVNRGPAPEALRSAPPPSGYTIRLEIEPPASSEKNARDQVLAALAGIEHVDVDYSEPLDLMVISPRG